MGLAYQGAAPPKTLHRHGSARDAQRPRGHRSRPRFDVPQICKRTRNPQCEARKHKDQPLSLAY
ncbi:hypothetical protein JANAI62_23310 [Jannaschia pagri]|uniref:Uncharacterized protein n=1 Tax=Jannaschia pagri TaxID=2829797 RepID=A0ABQ4NMR5_9RHOB|nr:hypothetical protein JANAI61_23320 [Jannaschia sp. AI_61]GIT95708.1 hypothetical protein JANAI62_23310 [Jannaschia sp. AI_62]